MRRGFSIVLMLVFGLGPLSTLVEGSEDSYLPLCCRRHGAHHCAMAMRRSARMRVTASGMMPMLSAPPACPQYPGLAAMFAAPGQALTVTVSEWAELAERAGVATRAPDEPREGPNRTHAGRGPPAFL